MFKTFNLYRAYLEKHGIWDAAREAEFKTEWEAWQTENPTPPKPVIPPVTGLPENFADLIATSVGNAIGVVVKPLQEQVTKLATDFTAVQTKQATDEATRTKTEAETKAKTEADKHYKRGAIGKDEIDAYVKDLTENFDVVSRTLAKIQDNPAIKTQIAKEEAAAGKGGKAEGVTVVKADDNPQYESKFARSIPADVMKIVASTVRD